MRHPRDLPKPGRRAGRVCRVYLDLDDRIGHLPLLPFSLVFSQVDTFLPFLPAFLGFLPLLAHSLRIPWVARQGETNVAQARRTFAYQFDQFLATLPSC